MLVIREGIRVGMVGMVIVSQPLYLGVPCLLALTDIHPLFAALCLDGRLNSLAVLAGHLLGVLCLVPVVDTLEGNSTASLHTFSIDLTFFYAFSNDSKALGKGPILETPQGNLTVFESFTGSRRYKVGWWEGFSGFSNLGSQQGGHS